MIVLTRPAPAARRFAGLLRARGVRVPILFSPVMRIERSGRGPLPDGTLIFTSENGVRAALSMGSLAGRTVIAVGARTASVAAACGARATALGGNVTALAEALIARADGPYVHLHGAEVTGNLVGDLRAAGLRATGFAIYRQTPRALTDAARLALTSDIPTILPLLSARSAEWAARDLDTEPRATVAVALSGQVLESWPWSDTALIARSTDITGMCDAVVQAIADRHGEGMTS